MSVAANSPVTSTNVNTAFMSRTAATTSTVAVTTFSNTTQSTDKDTGAVIIEGGLGVEKNINVGGNAGITGDLTVTGNLTVNGTTTTLNTATVESEDNNILLNKGGNDASAEGGGVDVQRTSDNGAFRFDSALTSKWKIGLASAMSEIITAAGNQILTGIKTFTDAITMAEISTPSTPASGYAKIYPKSDGRFYGLDDTGAEFLLGAVPNIVGTRASPQSITAGGGIAHSGANYFNSWFVVGSGGPVTITANPRIAAGTVGHRIKITGTDDTNYVEMADGNGIVTGGMTIRLGNNSVVVFEYDGTNWILESTNGLLV